MLSTEAAIRHILRVCQTENYADMGIRRQLEQIRRKAYPRGINHFAWEWMDTVPARSILILGAGTGLSLCHLLAASSDPEAVDPIVMCDPFDGEFGVGIISIYLARLGIPNKVIDQTTYLPGDPMVALQKYRDHRHGAQFDYILLDRPLWPKGYCSRVDWSLVTGLLRPGGVLVEAFGYPGHKGAWSSVKTHAKFRRFVTEETFGWGVRA